MRVGLVDCGSIPRTACELRSFSFIERRMLCWVGRAVRFRLALTMLREKRELFCCELFLQRRKSSVWVLGRFDSAWVLTILQQASEAIMLVS